MAKAEIDLWHWFILKYPELYDRVWFDVMIPSDPDLLTPLETCPSSEHAKWQWVWECLTCLRCDVLARRGLYYQVIEIRYAPRFQVMSMALKLTELFKQRFPNLRLLQPVLLCYDRPMYIKLTGMHATVTLIRRKEIDSLSLDSAL